METVHYLGHLREDGSISLPPRMRQKLRLRSGDKIEVVIASTNGRDRSRKHSIEMSKAKQRRMEELLFRNREGEITPDEKREMKALVLESQLLTIEKAQKMLQRLRRKS